jgi:hypothetical protein
MAMAGLPVGPVLPPLRAPSPETLARLEMVLPPLLARERRLAGIAA